MRDIKRTLYGEDGTGGLVACSKKLDKRKVSWIQLGTTVAIVVTILGATYLKVDFGYSKSIEKVNTRCDQNQKNLQFYSVQQAVLVDKIEHLTDAIKDQKSELKESDKVLHQRINKVLDAIEKIDK